MEYRNPGELIDANGEHIIETDSGFYPPLREDGVFMAMAREDVPRLLAEIERLEAGLREISSGNLTGAGCEGLADAILAGGTLTTWDKPPKPESP